MHHNSGLFTVHLFLFVFFFVLAGVGNRNSCFYLNVCKLLIQRALVYYFAGCTDSLKAHALQFSSFGVEVEAPLATPQITGESKQCCRIYH